MHDNLYSTDGAFSMSYVPPRYFLCEPNLPFIQYASHVHSNLKILRLNLACLHLCNWNRNRNRNRNHWSRLEPLRQCLLTTTDLEHLELTLQPCESIPISLKEALPYDIPLPKLQHLTVHKAAIGGEHLRAMFAHRKLKSLQLLNAAVEEKDQPIQALRTIAEGLIHIPEVRVIDLTATSIHEPVEKGWMAKMDVHDWDTAPMVTEFYVLTDRAVEEPLNLGDFQGIMNSGFLGTRVSCKIIFATHELTIFQPQEISKLSYS